MKILFAASEAFPFCKTGGLADLCSRSGVDFFFDLFILYK